MAKKRLVLMLTTGFTLFSLGFSPAPAMVAVNDAGPKPMVPDRTEVATNEIGPRPMVVDPDDVSIHGSDSESTPVDILESLA
ncbi:hypothetical protein [Caldibacillus debilis]|uniref:Secreted protein n=1 Tax=Caldibacillus debilis GB1 TaxID=1339248 RepID=A0A420VE39_9BACI|nr:hypothetical protein [Caldibacillus debilis]RKO61780.1 hypothetical protein Cdeb_01273 [Caldibacillus debilis GB1]